MYFISVILSIFSFAFGAETEIKVICDAENMQVEKSFSLITQLKVDQELKVNATVIVSLDDPVNGRSQLVIPARGFYKSVDALGGYEYTYLSPAPTDKSKVLDIGLKLNINGNLKSSLQTNEMQTYLSNCRTVK